MNYTFSKDPDTGKFTKVTLTAQDDNDVAALEELERMAVNAAEEEDDAA